MKKPGYAGFFHITKLSAPPIMQKKIGITLIQ